MANLQKYEDFSAEDAEAAEEELNKLGSNAFLKFPVGRTTMRILPAKVGDKTFVLVQQHFIDIPGKGTIVFACPRIHAKRSCPSCNEADRLRDSGNDADMERAKKFFPGLRVFCNAVDRRNPEAGVQIAAFGKQIYEQLLALRKNEEAGGNYTNPGPDGFDVIVERKGTGKNDTEYKVSAARANSPLGNDEWLEQQHNLKRYAAVLSAEELSSKLGGQRRSGGREGGSAPAEAKPAPRRTAAQDVMDVEGEDVT